MLRTGAVVAGRYRLEEILGRGGMADVFRAVDDRTDRVVALKALRISHPRDVERFHAEVAVLEQLDHPSVVALQDAGLHERLPYLVLDLVEGPALDDVLEDGPLGLERSIAAGRQVAVALAEAHRLGIVHRDVKPSNVLLDEAGRARLSDFGIARMTGAPRLTVTGAVIGSPAYVAPEQLGDGSVGPAADVYALGLLVIECLTGEPCYAGPPNEAALARLLRAPRIPDDVPGWLRGVLRAMTARHPDRRPSASAVADAFARRSVDGVLPTTRPLRRRTAPRRPAVAGWAEVVCAAIAAVILLTGLAAGTVVGMRDLRVSDAPAPTSSTTIAPPPTTAPVVARSEAVAEPANQGKGHGRDNAEGKDKGRGDDEGEGED